MLSSSVFLRTTTFQPLAMADMMKFGGRGADSLNSTVSLSRTLIDSTALNRELRGMLMPVGGFTMRSKVALISSAVMSAPSWKVTPSRRKNV